MAARDGADRPFVIEDEAVDGAVMVVGPDVHDLAGAAGAD